MTQTPTKAVDVVGIFGTDLKQVFPDARPLKSSILDEALFFKHPLESSATRTDHVIFQPVKVSISLVISGEKYKDVYKQIKQIYKNQTQLIVQTKTDIYENMYIQNMPYEEAAGNIDSAIMNLTLEETILAATKVTTYSPVKSSHKKTKKRGQQESSAPSDAQKKKGSTLYRWFG